MEFESANSGDQADFLKRLGGRIRELRRAPKLSQEKFGFACNLTQHYVSQVEKGERNVTILTAREMAKALDVTIEIPLADLN